MFLRRGELGRATQYPYTGCGLDSKSALGRVVCRRPEPGHRWKVRHTKSVPQIRRECFPLPAREHETFLFRREYGSSGLPPIWRRRRIPVPHKEQSGPWPKFRPHGTRSHSSPSSPAALNRGSSVVHTRQSRPHQDLRTYQSTRAPVPRGATGAVETLDPQCGRNMRRQEQ